MREPLHLVSGPDWPEGVARASHELINNHRIRAKLGGQDTLEELLARVEERLGAQLSPRPKPEIWERLETMRRELALDSGITISPDLRARICYELNEIIEELILHHQLNSMKEDEP
jgi:hypothetical protein